MQTLEQAQRHLRKGTNLGFGQPDKCAEPGHRQLPPSPAAPLRVGSDFSHIPINSPAAGVMQAKSAIEHQGDDYEQEADRISEQVVRAPDPQLQRRRASRITGGRRAVGQTAVPLIVNEALRGPGQPLDAATRAFMEPHFGYDFSRVRVHSGPVARQSARDVNADAYTVGHNVVFGGGGFMPATHEGRHLLAHELTHVVQQSAGAPLLQRTPAKDAPPPASPMTETEAEAWYLKMNVDDAFADPAPWAEGDPQLLGKALEEAIQESLQQSLTPEEMHRQLLVRRAQPLGATAYQAADPQAALAGMQLKITDIQAKINARKAKIAELKKLGPSSKGEIDAAGAEISAFEREVKTLNNARGRLPKASTFSRMGQGAPAGTGKITYAGIQVETAEGKRIALEFAETTSTEHAEEAIIRSIKSKLTEAQLRGARVTVVGDQVVCGERCVPALTQFAERYEIESVDSFVFQRTKINPLPPGFAGPPELASPRTTLRSMTESKSAGRELIKRELPIYRKPPARPPTGSGVAVTAGAESGAEHAVTAAAPASAEAKALAGIEHAAAKESPGFWSSMARNFAKELKNITPAKVARFGKNIVKDAVKGYVTGMAVDFTIGESRLEEDLATLDAANHKPHDSTPEKVRSFEKEAIGFLPPEIAIPIAANIRLGSPLNPEFLYEATVQEQQRKWEKFKEDYGDSPAAAQLYDQAQKHADDVYNGLEPY